MKFVTHCRAVHIHATVALRSEKKQDFLNFGLCVELDFTGCSKHKTESYSDTFVSIVKRNH